MIDYVEPRTPRPKKGGLHFSLIAFLLAVEVPIIAAMAA